MLTNKFPAMEENTNELLKKHLNIIAELIKVNLYQVEADEKLGRAIRSKLRPATNLIYELAIK